MNLAEYRNRNSRLADFLPWAALVGKAGHTVVLTVGPRADLAAGEHREVAVTCLREDQSLRRRAWIEANRQWVAERSQGKVGYIFVPNTGVDGQNELVRQYSGQHHLPALLIDDRWNGGGQIPHRGQGGHESAEVIHHRGHLRLLEHRLTDQDVVGVSRHRPPWEIPPVSVEPPTESAPCLGRGPRTSERGADAQRLVVPCRDGQF